MDLPEASDLPLSSLTAISPLDGRYGGQVKGLRGYFSEWALMRYRVLVEVRWLLQLSELEAVREVPAFSESGRRELNAAATEFGEAEGVKVKEVERITNHDVKAIEYVLKERFKDHPEVSKVSICVAIRDSWR